ncbi:MAG: hypothetical protein KC549_01210 [Myxococcales bacterium]|nr:hypothetical protein [Myxococcales bacterium]MCB9547295.1 hypothetical protein [Myxococcales bacterium]
MSSTMPAWESLSARDRDLVARAQRMLVALGDPGVARRAGEAGYDAEEHEAGWRALEVAAGRRQSFPLLLQVATAAASEAEAPGVAARYAALDAFENKWFPRVRTALQRFVPPEAQAQVVGAFFADLAQQPLGPGVVGSVSLFIQRLAELAASDAPGAAAAGASLQKKGLTPAAIADITATLEEARALAPASPPPDGFAQQVAALNAERAQALDTLRRWLNDWTPIFRDELPYHDRLRLGLVRSAGGRPASALVEEEPQA